MSQPNGLSADFVARFSKWILSPVPVSIVAGIMAGAAILLVSGKDPIAAYSQLLEGALAPSSLPDMLNWAVPVVGMTMVATIAFRAGLLNLGGDGQMLIGGIVAATLALYLPLPGYLTATISILAAMLFGGFYALIAAWGQVVRGIPMLVTSLLLNYPAIGVTSYLATFALRDKTSGLAQTPMIPDDVRLLSLSGPLNIGLLIMATLVAAVIFVDRRTVFGYEVRMRGANEAFAEYGGVDLARQTYKVMFVSGAVAGLVGAIVVLGSHYRFINGGLLAPGYGSSGFMAAMLSGGEPIGALLAGLFFAGLQTGGFAMQRSTDVPRVLTMVLQALIILFLALRGGLKKD